MKKPKKTVKKAPAALGNNQQEEAWLDRFVEQMAHPNNAEVKFYEDLKKKGQGFGLDHNGKLASSKKSKKK